MKQKTNNGELVFNECIVDGKINKCPVLELEPGDAICCKGIEAIIKEITYQDYYKGYFETEFTDTTGKYRSWKQIYDGGRVIDKDYR